MAAAVILVAAPSWDQDAFAHAFDHLDPPLELRGSAAGATLRPPGCDRHREGAKQVARDKKLAAALQLEYDAEHSGEAERETAQMVRQYMNVQEVTSGY